jgi:glyceraldehyde-3-phosphate dehydrogenase (NADP+)
MPWDEGVQLTPLPEPGKPAYLAKVVAEAVAAGACLPDAQLEIW